MVKYLIMNYQTEEVLYYGPSLWRASVELEPGTVYGKGFGRMECLKEAIQRARSARGE